ncbi:MAG: Gfo/Idh/MocA family oxidoreductase [Anaerolineales bacterium]|nr:Gfo/Idh/MocA family oxidoreductase [Anaerolineales bacterium]
MKIGVIGCGNISDVYLQNLKSYKFLDVLACADLLEDRAKEKSAHYGIPWVSSPDELLSIAEIDIVVDLTNPEAHADINLGAIEAGKSVYSEKPLANQLDEGIRILEEAREQGVRVGCAPDTFIGGGLQTCRNLLDEGAIGAPIGATAFFLCPGHERWHPDPVFYYQPGAGPMLDMGPYYLTTLVALLGPVRMVSGFSQTTYEERMITSQPRYGQKIEVNTPTHITGTMEFASGVIATIITSFDVWGHQLPNIEIYGTEGSMNLPDPNTFGGPVHLIRSGENEWSEIPLTHGHTGNERGIGVADMAISMKKGRPHRASGEMAYHVLEMMHGFLQSSTDRKHIQLSSSCDRPAALNVGWLDGV